MLSASNETVLASCNAMNVTPGALIVGTLCVISLMVTIHVLAMLMPREKNYHAMRISRETSRH